jgi:hypothetical protein
VANPGQEDSNQDHVGNACQCLHVACQPGPCFNAGVCDPATGACSQPPKPDGTSCDDANECSGPDGCVAGRCTGPSLTGTACNDHDACTQTDLCALGACVGSNPVVCAPNNDECHFPAVCLARDGTCNNPGRPNGTPCHDGTCQYGLCQSNANLCFSSCCGILYGPGCSDPVVAACVCRSHPECCNTVWTAACAGFVTSLGCGNCQVPCDDGLACTQDSCSNGAGASCQHLVTCASGGGCSGGFCSSGPANLAEFRWICR